MMKQVIAYIKPHKLEAVMLALHAIEQLSGISVLEMQGCGRSRKNTARSLFDEDNYGLEARIKLEVACPDQLVQTVEYTKKCPYRSSGRRKNLCIAGFASHTYPYR